MTLNFKKQFKSYLISFIVSLLVGGILFLIYFLTHSKAFIDVVDGFTLSTIVLLGIGGLMFVAYEGFFDVFAYGFKQLGTAWFSKKANENNDFPGYKENKRIKREEQPKLFISMLAASGVFLITMIVLRIVLFTM